MECTPPPTKQLHINMYPSYIVSFCQLITAKQTGTWLWNYTIRIQRTGYLFRNARLPSVTGRNSVTEAGEPERPDSVGVSTRKQGHPSREHPYRIADRIAPTSNIGQSKVTREWPSAVCVVDDLGHLTIFSIFIFDFQDTEIASRESEIVCEDPQVGSRDLEIIISR